MRRHLLAVAAAVLALGFAASTASAQCGFDHPKKAKKFQGELVQAFVSCGNVGGNEPNTSTGGGVPACTPPQTFNQAAGPRQCVGGSNNGAPCSDDSECPGGKCQGVTGVANGWRMDPLAFQGKIQLKIKKFCTGKSKGSSLPPCNALDTDLNPSSSADLEVQLKLKGVIDNGGPATGTGTLATVARATMEDSTVGDATIVDFPATFPFDLVEGKASMKTSADAMLNSLALESLPACASLEIVDINVIDENANTFVRVGTWLKQ